jgi:D-beta-D-heptose 7-phosphate kinase/D-beta-D-heptose 1-phosphate adenosyltransferase
MKPRPTSFSPVRLNALIRKMQGLKILVIGDVMLDEFIWGQVSRISPEAPVPVVHVGRETAYPGGAANVARNLADFGCRVGICGLVGRDGPGNKLSKLLSDGRIESKGMLKSGVRETIVKTRIIAQQQQVVRVDREKKLGLTAREFSELCGHLRKCLPDYDAVILEDYGKGLLTQALVDEILEICQRLDIPVTVDPNPHNPLEFHGATVVKPNRSEAFATAGRPIESGDKALKEVGAVLMRRWNVPYLLITLGEDGMMLFERDGGVYHSPSLAREVFDVSGAGDTAIAFFTVALAAGLSGAEATEMANHASGVVVSKLGTATLSAGELKQSLMGGE